MPSGQVFSFPTQTSLQIEFIWRDQTRVLVTSPCWVKFVLRRPAHFLTDGQHLERKTTALALHFYKLLVVGWGLVKWPWLLSEILRIFTDCCISTLFPSKETKQTCKLMRFLSFLLMSWHLYCEAREHVVVLASVCVLWSGHTCLWRCSRKALLLWQWRYRLDAGASLFQACKQQHAEKNIVSNSLSWESCNVSSTPACSRFLSAVQLRKCAGATNALICAWSCNPAGVNCAAVLLQVGSADSSAIASASVITTDTS